MRTIIFYLFLIIYCLVPLSTFALNPFKANFGIYGIQKCNTLAEYQKYVGQTVVYLPNEAAIDEDKKKFGGEFNQKYIISKISGDDTRMTFLLSKQGGSKKVYMLVYNESKDSDSFYKYYSITDSFSIPLLLIDKFDSDKNQLMGKTFINDKVITKYQLVDVIMKSIRPKYSFQDMPYPTLHYVIKNTLSGEEREFPAESAAIDCFSEDLSGQYVATLSKVEKPADESIRYGETEIVIVEGVTKYRYFDDVIDILIFCNGNQFGFHLKNLSQNTLKLIWDEAVFVDFKGTASRVIHVGTKFSQKDEAQTASTIIKGANIEDIAVPICNIGYSGDLMEWTASSMYPEIPETSPGELKLMLPIQVKAVINEYIFAFRVDWVYNHPERLKLSR